jgi:hypothetical protein
VTGLVGGRAGYVAVVGVPGDDAAYRLWSSADARHWERRADQDTVFSLLHGVTGDLYADLAATPGPESRPRPIAFTYDGAWLEIVEAHGGRRYLTVAVAARDGIRVLSGFLGRDRPEPLLLRAGG